jgi:hypothetical protein
VYIKVAIQLLCNNVRWKQISPAYRQAGIPSFVKGVKEGIAKKGKEGFT